MSDKFEACAIVELFGHQVIAGRVSEQVIGGQGFVRVDVPTTTVHAKDGDQVIEGFTKFYGAGAIYALTPTDEATMLAAVTGLQARPIETWKLQLPQLTVEHEEDEGSEE